MNLHELCLALPGATTDVKWGNNLCYCVYKKMFAITGDGPESTELVVKTTKEAFKELVQRDGFKPAPYLARYSWVLVEDYTSLSSLELELLVSSSYSLVVRGLSKKVQRSLHGG